MPGQDKHKRRRRDSQTNTTIQDVNDFHVELRSKYAVDFRPEGTVGPTLGFGRELLPANVTHCSDHLVDIMRVRVVRVECNIVSGSYMNGKHSHTLHEFYPSVKPGYKLIQVPSNVIYLPVTQSAIDTLVVRLLDQDDRPVNFQGEKATLRLHLRPV